MRDDFPMSDVSWYGSIAFCAWLGTMLPTEAQWEYAARKTSNAGMGGAELSVDGSYAGESTNYDEVGWHRGNSSSTSHEVGTRKPTALGLYDINGNVYEWCGDWYVSPYPTQNGIAVSGTATSGSYTVSTATGNGTTTASAVVNPIYNYGGLYRVFRGGYWYDDVYLFFPLGIRSDVAPSYGGDALGFRSVGCVSCP
jgi:formylglycine-generating enzyme required for sulfatase activity